MLATRDSSGSVPREGVKRMALPAVTEIVLFIKAFPRRNSSHQVACRDGFHIRSDAPPGFNRCSTRNKSSDTRQLSDVDLQTNIVRTEVTSRIPLNSRTYSRRGSQEPRWHSACCHLRGERRNRGRQSPAIQPNRPQVRRLHTPPDVDGAQHTTVLAV